VGFQKRTLGSEEPVLGKSREKYLREQGTTGLQEGHPYGKGGSSEDGRDILPRLSRRGDDHRKSSREET